MNLSKALKTKNRLTGEISRLQTQFLTSNYKDSRIPDHPAVSSIEIFNTLTNKVNDLIALKTKIALANVGIFESIERMAQLKSLIAKVESLNSEITAPQKVDRFDKDSKETFVLTPFILPVEKEKIRADLQAKIEALQDQIDDYNAKTQI